MRGQRLPPMKEIEILASLVTGSLLGLGKLVPDVHLVGAFAVLGLEVEALRLSLLAGIHERVEACLDLLETSCFFGVISCLLACVSWILLFVCVFLRSFFPNLIPHGSGIIRPPGDLLFFWCY